jgi:hypothetical protein
VGLYIDGEAVAPAGVAIAAIEGGIGVHLARLPDDALVGIAPPALPTDACAIRLRVAAP